MGCLAPLASAEVTANEVKGLAAAAPSMPPGMAVYIAALPTTTAEDLLHVSKTAFDLGLRPVPHLVARNYSSTAEFETTLKRLVGEAGVRRALVLGGDRGVPEGPFGSALSLLETGLFGEDTIPNVAFGCYPEGHPRIADDMLDRALFKKLDVAERFGLNARLITQICFDAETILDFTRELRSRGAAVPIRYGVVGPTKFTTLAKYAAACGIGPSMRGLMERRELRGKLLTGYTPDGLISHMSKAANDDPALNLLGPHFFTFGSLKRSIDWLAQAFVHIGDKRTPHSTA